MSNVTPQGSALEKFYSSMNLPGHMRNLLSAYGVEQVADLVGFDKEAIKSIENGVRDGSFAKGFICLTSKQEQKRYFGAPVVDLHSFSFRTNHSVTLSKIAENAKIFLETEKAKKESFKKRPRAKTFSLSSGGISQSSTTSSSLSKELEPQG